MYYTYLGSYRKKKLKAREFQEQVIMRQKRLLRERQELAWDIPASSNVFIWRYVYIYVASITLSNSKRVPFSVLRINGPRHWASTAGNITHKRRKSDDICFLMGEKKILLQSSSVKPLLSKNKTKQNETFFSPNESKSNQTSSCNCQFTEIKRREKHHKLHYKENL